MRFNGLGVNRKRHRDVLLHIMGYFKRSIDSGDETELVDIIEARRCGEVRLVVPISLLRHYLGPYPDELSSRNAV